MLILQELSLAVSSGWRELEGGRLWVSHPTSCYRPCSFLFSQRSLRHFSPSTCLTSSYAISVSLLATSPSMPSASLCCAHLLRSGVHKMTMSLLCKVVVYSHNIYLVSGASTPKLVLGESRVAGNENEWEMRYIMSFATLERPCSWNGVMDRYLPCLTLTFIITGYERLNHLFSLGSL